MLAMLFLVMFGSLAVAMAVVAQGNLRTADSSLHVSRAMSAAETGLVFGARRLQEQARRFVVTEGVIDADFAESLWLGTIAGDDFDLLDPVGYVEDEAPAGMLAALAYVFTDVDDHAIEVTAGDASLPLVDDDLGILELKPIPVSAEASSAYFRLRYELVEGQPFVRITSRGVDDDIVREISMDFRIGKRIEYAVISPNRIMIGKNVMIEGPLGSLYGTEDGELDTANGDPLVMRSDFYDLDPDLDDDLDDFYALVVDYDVDGDARLRPGHPEEGVALVDEPGMVDVDGDEFVTDFDLFLSFYDDNDDAGVVYDEDLAIAAGLDSTDVECDDVDDQLMILIDEAFPDRNGDGIEGGAQDVALGWRDGRIDALDQYAKVTGRLRFGVVRDDWEDAHGESYQTVVEGPISPGLEEAPIGFEVSEDELLEITTDMFDDSQSWFEDQVPAAGSTDFADQAAAYGGSTSTLWEEVPWGSVGAYDYYERPVYEDMTFTNVRIPMGTNALFVNCVFVGVTYIESRTDCEHPDWNYAGALQWDDADGDGVIESGELTTKFPGVPPQEAIDAGDIVADTRTVSNNIRFHDCTFLGSIAGDRIGEYTHWRNKVQMTGNSRFYLDPEDADLVEEIDGGNADAETWQTALEGIDEDDRIELSKSSMLMPGWSMDVGNFANEVGVDPADTAKVKLKGVIIAGILDVRGTAEIFGTLLMTFRPVDGEGPLYYGGQTDAFNTTIGYFGPADGDSEGVDPDDAGFEGFGEIRLRYDPDALLPDGIPWPISVEAVPETYLEGGFS